MKQYPKDLIISLIKADLLHNQLINGLSELHLDTNHYELGLGKVVAQLMGIKGNIPDAWWGKYLEHFEDIPPKFTEIQIEHLAEKCFCHLCQEYLQDFNQTTISYCNQLSS